MASPIKIFEENGHYYIQIVKRLPKRGNARILYILKDIEESLIVNAFYKWNTFTFEYDKISIEIDDENIPIYASEEEAIAGGLKKGTRYSTATGELRIKL